MTAATFAYAMVLRHRTFYLFPDNINQFYAWYQKLAVAVHHGTLPLWDANTSGGHSFVGELQEGVFYPINLIWVALFGSAHGINIHWLDGIVIFHFWLASVGMYLVGRVIGLSKPAALAAALAYAFGGCVALRSVSQTAIFFGLCYIPWAFYGFERWRRDRRPLALVGCAIALGLIILAGHLDPWYFACLLILLSVVFHHARADEAGQTAHQTIRDAAALIGVAVGSLVVALPQVVLSAQYLPVAVRLVSEPQPITLGEHLSLIEFTTGFNFNPQGFLSLIDPIQYQVADGNPLYIGLTGLAVIALVVGFLRPQLRGSAVWRGWRRFLIGASLVAGVLMLGYWTLVPAVLNYVPLFSQVRQLARYAVIVQFCLAIMLGICIDLLATHHTQLRHTKARFFTTRVGAVILVVVLGLNVLYLHILSDQWGFQYLDRHFVDDNGIVVLTLAGCFILRSHIDKVLLFGVAATAFISPAWFMPLIAGDPAAYPPTYYQVTPAVTYLERFYGRARVLIENNALPPNIGDVYNIQTVGGVSATLSQAFYDFITQPDPAGEPGQHLDLLNVRFVVSTTPVPGLTKVFTDPVRDISIYERPHYLPRAYFASQAADCNTHRPGCTPIDITYYSDSQIRVHFTAPAPEVLVLSEVDYPGWSAIVNGKPAPITGYSPTSIKLFRSVNVPAGSDSVTFRYEPFGL